MEKKESIEKLRDDLNKKVTAENLSDTEIIDLSLKLDAEIVDFYKEGAVNMSGISIKKDRILFYGNTAGYVDKGKAIVDPMFHCGELNDFLTIKERLSVEWTNGVYDRLVNSKQDLGEQQILKLCRIHQLKPEVDPMIKFVGYDELRQGEFGKLDHQNYQVVYDGQIETNDLDAIFEKFNLNHPPGFQGHSLSMSDVIELYDKDSSEFYYVDHYDFKEIDFYESDQEQQGGQSMKL